MTEDTSIRVSRCVCSTEPSLCSLTYFCDSAESGSRTGASTRPRSGPSLQLTLGSLLISDSISESLGLNCG